MNKLINFATSHYGIISFITAVIIAVIIIQQSIFLRWFGYETIPSPITDEYDYVWQGLSIREHGLPVAWSILSHIYGDAKYNSRGGNLDGFGITVDNKLINLNEFKKDSRPIIAIEQIDYVKGIEHMFFVAPFFDHPPLGGLIYSLGENSNIRKVDDVKPVDFRKPALAMALITTVLIFIFLFLITSTPWISVLGVIIYSTVPTYLLATRTSFLENVVPPFILINLILLFLMIKSYEKSLNKNLIYFITILSGLVGGLGVLAKESALGFIIGSIILLIINKLPKKIIFIFLVSLGIPVFIYICWGLWLQKELFIDIFIANSNRGYFGALKMASMLEALKFKDFPIDGWWIWGFISLLLISIKVQQKKLLFLIIPLAFNLLFCLLLGGPNYPWYFISSIPFLACCSAVLIWQIYENPNIPTALVFFIIPFSSSYYWGRVALNLQPSINHYRMSFMAFSVCLFIVIKFGKYKIIKLAWFIFLAILIYKIVIFNEVFMPYLIANWGKLPIPSLPNF